MTGNLRHHDLSVAAGRETDDRQFVFRLQLALQRKTFDHKRVDTRASVGNIKECRLVEERNRAVKPASPQGEHVPIVIRQQPDI